VFARATRADFDGQERPPEFRADHPFFQSNYIFKSSHQERVGLVHWIVGINNKGVAIGESQMEGAIPCARGIINCATENPITFNSTLQELLNHSV